MPHEKLTLMSEAEYLRLEEKATVRHEFVDGVVFTMTGATIVHSVICGNIFSFIHSFLRGTCCRAHMQDVKVKIQSANCYYYPDVLVSCEPIEPDCAFESRPILLFEILSPSTAAIDKREKLVAYRKIPSLMEYVIVHQKRQFVELYRRTSDKEWTLITFPGDSPVMLESIPKGTLSLPFEIIYERCNPPLRVKEDEEMYAYDEEDFASNIDLPSFL